jgi:penicillin-binding protein 2
VAVAYAALANGGHVLRPFVVKKIIRSDGTVVRQNKRRVVNELGGVSGFVSAINEGLLEAVHDEKFGTAKLAAVHPGRLAGKTGTAQVRKLNRRRNRDTVSHFRGRDHAWFAGFAPFDEPKISVVVFLEHGGSGGKQAAPIARKILERYDRRIHPLFERDSKSEKRGTP